MASSEEILRGLYQAWNRADFDGLRAHLHPAVEWHSSGLFPGLEPVYVGPEEVRRWWLTLREPFDEWTIDLEEVSEVGDRTVTLVCFHAVGKESGVRVDLPFAHVFEFEGDLIRRYWSYDSLEKALADHAG